MVCFLFAGIYFFQVNPKFEYYFLGHEKCIFFFSLLKFCYFFGEKCCVRSFTFYIFQVKFIFSRKFGNIFFLKKKKPYLPSILKLNGVPWETARDISICHWYTLEINDVISYYFVLLFYLSYDWTGDSDDYHYSEICNLRFYIFLYYRGK